MPRDEARTEGPFTVTVGPVLDVSLLHSESKDQEQQKMQSRHRHRLDPGAHLSVEVEFRRQTQASHDWPIKDWRLGRPELGLN